ncbi:hypothetical protein AVEN_243778-1 [Araneus ventricosus]|uniref:Uncharacterized protein n=1 Tax=Araneus ventricosus TaxID=182803 RepID=A0A4Y2A6B6_ARAVE|nr:hypothetical protein AVEN_243778-1 [Araneus ventricosus]
MFNGSFNTVPFVTQVPRKDIPSSHDLSLLITCRPTLLKQSRDNRSSSEARRRICSIRPGAHKPIRAVEAIKITIVSLIPPVKPQRGHVGYYCYISLLNDTNRLVCTGPYGNDRRPQL